MAKFDYKKWVIENKYGKLNEQPDPIPPNPGLVDPLYQDVICYYCSPSGITAVPYTQVTLLDPSPNSPMTGGNYDLTGVSFYFANQMLTQTGVCGTYQGNPAYVNPDEVSFNVQSTTFTTNFFSGCQPTVGPPTQSYTGIPFSPTGSATGSATGSMAGMSPLGIGAVGGKNKFSLKRRDRKKPRRIPTRGLKEVRDIIKKMIEKNK